MRALLALLSLLLLAYPVAAQQQTINVGAAANDGTGDSFRTAFTKTNTNFSVLFAALASKQPLSANLTALSAYGGVGTTAGTLAAGNDSRIVNALQNTRQIFAGSGLTGGGDLSADRTLALGTTGVTPGSYTGANITVGADGRLTAAANGNGSGAVIPLGQARLVYTNSTTLTLKPLNGNQILIAGVLRTIPSGGVTLSNTGLTAGTVYYVYAYWTGSTVALLASTTGHIPDPNYGIEVASSDYSRTYVGLTYTGAGSPGVLTYSASAPYVISQFNSVQNESFAALNAYVQNSTTIPVDDTIPQITEGAQLMTTAILPRSATSRMRIRFTGWVQTNGTNNLVFALFDGNSNAIQSSLVAPAGAAYAQQVAFEFEYVPGVTSPLTYSIRWGTSGGGEYLNGASTARLLGGSSSATLLVEEIPQ